jgi:hypothetical protein
MTARIDRSVSADDLLRPYSLASLTASAEARGIDPAHKTKGKLLQVLSTALYDADTIASILAKLGPSERDLLDRVVLLGGEVLTASLRHQLGAEGAIDSPDLDRTNSGPPTMNGTKGRFEDIVARLSTLGLLFGTNVGPYRQHVELGSLGKYLYIPRGVMRHLPPPTSVLETSPPPMMEEAADRDAWLRDVYMLVAAVRDEPILLSARGQIPKRQLIRIDQLFRRPEGAAGVRSESELGRLPLLRALAEDLQLVLQGARGLVVGDDVLSFLTQAPAIRQRRLYDAYVRTKRWSELSRIRDVTVSPRANMTGPKVVSARKVVLDEVAELPTNVWIPTTHLVDRIRRRAFEFLVERNWQYSHYYYGSSFYSDPEPYWGSNSLGLSFYSKDEEEAVDWDTIEGGFIRGAVEALHWLGVLDLGSMEGQTPSIFRLTETGGQLLLGEVPASTPSRPNVVVQPNFQVLAFEPTSEDILFTLDRIAQRVRAEQVVEYYLTRAAIYDAQRSGMEIGDVIAFLDRVGSTPLPQNVRRSLEEWGAGHQRVVVRRGLAALQAGDESILDGLFADPELTALLGRRLSKTVVLVPVANLETVRRHLVADPSHPLPALTEGNDALQGACLRIDGDGRVTFLQPVASVYVRAALRPFVNEEPDGSVCITPASLRRAVETAHDRTSRTAEEIIATLERLHAGPLPADVIALVRRWAKEWGRGAIAQVAMLQVETEEIMQGLLEDADLQSRLQAVPGNPALATISPEDLSYVRALLQERGMELGDTPDLARVSGQDD